MIKLVKRYKAMTVYFVCFVSTVLGVESQQIKSVEVTTSWFSCILSCGNQGYYCHCCCCMMQCCPKVPIIIKQQQQTTSQVSIKEKKEITSLTKSKSNTIVSEIFSEMLENISIEEANDNMDKNVSKLYNLELNTFLFSRQKDERLSLPMEEKESTHL